MEDKLREEITTVVTAIFENKKEVDQRERTQQALETAGSSIETLSTEVKDSKKTITSLEEAKTALEAELVTAKQSAEDSQKETDAKLVAASTELEGVKTQFADVSTELKDLKQEAIASTRMSEIEEAGVIREDAADQKEKVKGMSDEAFTAYKAELIDIRKSILAELEEANKLAASNDGTADPNNGDVPAADGVVTPPANVDPSQAATAALNLELDVPADLLKEYASLGQAMADQMVKKSNPEGGK